MQTNGGNNGVEAKRIGLLGTHEISSLTLKEQAYHLIKDGILYHKLKVGTVYSQDAICGELGISRTPVREALLQLEQEGYVAFFRGRGFEVIPITDARAAQIMEARYFLEQAGCRLASLRWKPDQLRAVEDVLQEMRENCAHCNAKLMYRLDRSFHARIFEAAGNRWMLQEIETLRDHFLRFETLSAFDNVEQARDVIEEHQKIVDAIRKRNPEEAEAAMRSHLERTSMRTTRHLLPFYEEGSLGKSWSSPASSRG